MSTKSVSDLPPPQILATDLDGTFIPLTDQPEQVEALRIVSDAAASGILRLVYCTGRRFDSVRQAMQEYDLPEPEWVICDVGTSIYQHREGEYRLYEPYREHLSTLAGIHSPEALYHRLEGLHGLHLQAEEHQQEFKFSYECDTEDLNRLLKEIQAVLDASTFALDVHGSVDPFRECGLIDLLPRGVQKGYAVEWLAANSGMDSERILFSGDSGNDYAALIAGFRAIVVANAAEGLADKVRHALRQRGQEDRLFCADQPATIGVLQGCRHFGLLPG